MGKTYQSSEINVYLESVDGNVFSGRSMMGTISAETNSSMLSTWHMELDGIGPPSWVQGSQLARKIAQRFLPSEWECKFCERANPVDSYQCQSCGWYRGIIADVVQEMGIWRPR